MLIEVSAENVALMERAQLSFGPGFTAITGETGAGKSMLVGSISLCLGERADTDMVRAGASRATVQAVFEPDEPTRKLLHELGYSSEDGLLYLQREVVAEGKSQSRINGRLAPLSVAKKIGDSLADLHGQHEHQRLLDPSMHLAILDSWVGEQAEQLKQKIALRYAKVRDLRSALRDLEQDEREREQRIDILRFQVGEIRDAAPKHGEIAQLEDELSRLKNAELLSMKLSSACEAVYAGDVSAIALLTQAVKAVDSVADITTALADTRESLQSCLYALEDAVDKLRHDAGSIEFNPAKADEIAERLDLLFRLRRKYGDSESEILAFLAQSERSLELLENAEASLETLANELRAAEAALQEACSELSAMRKKRAEVFCERVVSELRELSMPAAQFSAKFSQKQPEADGADSLEFLFSANRGEPEKSLVKIASGGEISRVMLAIKTTLAGKGGVPTLIFDEVDSGLGGQTAAVVAKKLEKLAEDYQVIVITHLPQIASRATAQFTVEKYEERGRSLTRIRPLRQDERVEEIARMLAGEIITDAALENAKQLLG